MSDGPTRDAGQLATSPEFQPGQSLQDKLGSRAFIGFQYVWRSFSANNSDQFANIVASDNSVRPGRDVDSA
jgi:hypothetical protein